MRKELIALFTEGRTMAELRDSLDGRSIGGRPLEVTVDPRALPYLDHKVTGWVDGPPSSNVVAVISGADPHGGKWRRFALSQKGSWKYEVDAFPTPFSDARAPLSPGIPPGGRAAH